MWRKSSSIRLNSEEEEQEEGAVEDADMDDAGEVVVEGDGNGDAEEGQVKVRALTLARKR